MSYPISIREASVLEAADSVYGTRATPLARLVDALNPDCALLIVRAEMPTTFEWLSEERLERCIGPALLGPTDVEIWTLNPETRAVRLRFPGGGGTHMRSLEIHALRQFFEKQIREEWPADRENPPLFTVVPFTPLSHLENLQDNIAELNSLLDTIVNRQLKPQFQPIVNLRDGRAFGYETLIRGPKNALVRRPGQMFRVADKARVVSWFDLACMEECLRQAGELQMKQLLFLNMDAEGLSAMGMQERPLALRARELGMSPTNIVIEITERQMVGDFPRLLEEIRLLREQGFQIAIDDAGAGYSSLRAVAELHPDFVKIDRDLVKNIDVCGERRALLSALSQYARSVGASVIAEGAETREELAVLIDLGIPYGQGYVLGKPSDVLRGTPRDTREFIQARVELRERRRLGSDINVGSLARPGLVMDGADPLSEAARRFSKEAGLTSIAVTTDGCVCGLLTRQQLDHILTHVKSARAAEMMPAETLAQWMRTDILRVSLDSPAREVIGQVVAQQALALDADVLVLDRAGSYYGVVSVRSLIEVAADRPVSHARYADPLTGLPGRMPFERELRARVEGQAPLGIIRLDVSHLAAVNDAYGLERGDELILALAEVASSACRRRGSATDMCAHLGGDNFLLLTTGTEIQQLCEEILEGFTKKVAKCAPNAGKVAADGQSPARPPMVTLAVGALTNRTRRFQSIEQIMNGLYDIMRTAKEQPGNRIVIDGVVVRP